MKITTETKLEVRVIPFSNGRYWTIEYRKINSFFWNRLTIVYTLTSFTRDQPYLKSFEIASIEAEIFAENPMKLKEFINNEDENYRIEKELRNRTVTYKTK